MNLLIYTPQMGAYGGMESHICLLAIECARAGARVHLVTTSNSLNAQLAQSVIAAGVKLHELPVQRGSASAITKLIWLTMIALRLRPYGFDLIYTNGQSGLAEIMWLCRQEKTRLVHHVHTAADDEERKTWNFMYRHLLSNCPELIACSRYTGKELERFLGRNQIVFLPYLTPAIESESAVCNKSYSRDSILNFGYVGRLVSTKGIDTICRLSTEPELANVRWHIYGAGDDFPPRFFDTFPNVAYHGVYKDSLEYARILQDLDAVVLFSRHNEGMPLSLIEAMSKGLPWIATSRGGTPELAECSQNCVLIPTDADYNQTKLSVAELVEAILTGSTSRIEQAKIYQQRFAPGMVARQWLKYMAIGP